MPQPSSTVTPSATALLVIDIQRGAFDGQCCPPIDAGDALVSGARALIQAARDARVPVVFIQHSEDTPGEAFEEGTPHWELHEKLVPDAGDFVMKKYASSSFERTGLDDYLRLHNVGRVVLCGLQSEFCVTNTARAALRLGYAVDVAADGHATWPSQGRSAAAIKDEVNEDLAHAGAQVLAIERLAGELRRSSR